MSKIGKTAGEAITESINLERQVLSKTLIILINRHNESFVEGSEDQIPITQKQVQEIATSISLMRRSSEQLIEYFAQQGQEDAGITPEKLTKYDTYKTKLAEDLNNIVRDKPDLGPIISSALDTKAMRNFQDISSLTSITDTQREEFLRKNNNSISSSVSFIDKIKNFMVNSILGKAILGEERQKSSAAKMEDKHNQVLASTTGAEHGITVESSSSRKTAAALIALQSKEKKYQTFVERIATEKKEKDKNRER